jgi:hypothetical protein
LKPPQHAAVEEFSQAWQPSADELRTVGLARAIVEGVKGEAPLRRADSKMK